MQIWVEAANSCIEICLCVLTLTNAHGKLLPACLEELVPWCSGQTCGPVKAEIAGSNPVGTAKIETEESTQMVDSSVVLRQFLP